MRTSKLILISLALTFPALLCQQMFWTLNAPAAHYVDAITPGSDSNPGTKSAPWATLAHADAVLPVNAPLQIRYPDLSWHASPAYWHGLRAFFSMIQGSDATKVYDSANGLICSVGGGTVAYQTPGISLSSSGYVNCGAGALGVGTGDQSLLATVYPSSVVLGGIFSNGSLAGTAGYSLWTNTGPPTLNYQIRSAGTPIFATTSAYTVNQTHTLVSTLVRSSSTGEKLYVDGVLADTQDPTALTGQNLTNGTQRTLMGARDNGGANLFVPMNWLAEIRVYSLALSASDVATATAEANNRLWRNFGSGTFYAMAINGAWSTSTLQHVERSINGTGVFGEEVSTYATRPLSGFGNPQVLCINTAKCNGSTLSNPGEINWLMTHEVPPTVGNPMYVATSADGVTWTYIATMPTAGGAALTCTIQGGWFVDSGDPTDYHNIHQICGQVTSGNSILESHPTNAAFTSWSAPVTLLSFGNNVFNPVVTLISGTYTMLFSNYNGSTHYMHKATCTSGCMTGTNNWTVTQTGNWSGLGSAEAYSLIPLGGSTWRLYFYDFSLQAYSTSTDNLATWSAETTIPTLSSPNAVGYVKLQ